MKKESRKISFRYLEFCIKLYIYFSSFHVYKSELLGIITKPTVTGK